MENLFKNIYGNILKKICIDLFKQIEEFDGELDVDGKKNLKNLKELIVEPLKIYKEYYIITENDILFEAYNKYVNK